MQTLQIKTQRGISIIVVVFILAVVTIMGLSISILSSTQHMSSAYAFRGSQAYFAARAAVDYALARIVGGANCGGISPSINVNGFAVTMVCVAIGPYNEGTPADSYSIYNITATASSGGFAAPDAVNRQVRASIKFP